jgi:hypothetical protein
MTEQEQVSLNNDIKPKLSIDDTVKTLQGYLTQADQSLQQIENNIEKVKTQLNELVKMQITVVGQKLLAADLLKKIIGETDTNTKQ